MNYAKQQYADAALAGLRAACPQLLGKKPSAQSIERSIERAIADLMHLTDWTELDWARVVSRGTTAYSKEMGQFYAEERGATHSRRYTGWDRIHDDNKAEGRPIGNQWSDKGVHYVNGIKTRG